MAPPKLVPNKSGGATRRAYQFSQSQVPEGSGALKLKTPSFRGKKASAGSSSAQQRTYSKGVQETVSFGSTGFVDPLFKSPKDD